MAASQREELEAEYREALVDLRENNKPVINLLTMLANDKAEEAPDGARIIARVIEQHLHQVPANQKLFVLYLIDSIIKNCVDKPYRTIFAENLTKTFVSVFRAGDERTRASMFRVRQTWNEYFVPSKLHAIDVKVSEIDPAWPVQAYPGLGATPAPPPGHPRGPPPGTAPQPPGVTRTIHVNPKFVNSSGPPQKVSASEAALRRQQELLRIQHEKKERELEQQRQELRQKQFMLEMTEKQILQREDYLNRKEEAAKSKRHGGKHAADGPRSKHDIIRDRYQMESTPGTSPGHSADSGSEAGTTGGPGAGGQAPARMDTASLPIKKRRHAAAAASTPPRSDGETDGGPPPKRVSGVGSDQEERRPEDEDLRVEYQGTTVVPEKRRDRPLLDSGGAVHRGGHRHRDLDHRRLKPQSLKRGSRTPKDPHDQRWEGYKQTRPIRPPVNPDFVDPATGLPLDQPRPTALFSLNSDGGMHIGDFNAGDASRLINLATHRLHQGEITQSAYEEIVRGVQSLVNARGDPEDPSLPFGPDGYQLNGRHSPNMPPNFPGGPPGPGGRGMRDPGPRMAPGNQMGGGRLPFFPRGGPAEAQSMRAAGGDPRGRFPPPPSHMAENVRPGAPLSSVNGPGPQHGGPWGPEDQIRPGMPPGAPPGVPFGGPADPSMRPPGPGLVPGQPPNPAAPPQGGEPQNAPAAIPPNNNIFVDGRAYKVQYIGDISVIERSGLPHRISFVGPPRDVIIDGVAYTLAFGERRAVSIDGQRHVMMFGGPSRELYIGSTPLRGSFGGPPIHLKINGMEHKIQLGGEPPEVKIDPEADYELMRFMPNQQRPQYRPMLMNQTPRLPPSNAPSANPNVTITQVADPRPPAPGTALPGTTNVAELVKKLIATGMLKPPSANEPAPTQPQPATGSTTTGEPEVRKGPRTAFLGSNDEPVARKAQPSRGLKEFNIKDLRVRYTSEIHSLYPDGGQQCGMCGQRFEVKNLEPYSKHLDWHFHQNREYQRQQSRFWYIKGDEWIDYKEMGEETQAQVRTAMMETWAANRAAAHPSMAAAGDTDQTVNADDVEDQTCHVCCEKLEQFYDEDDEVWKLKNSMMAPDGKVYHPNCYQDVRTSDTGSFNMSSVRVKEEPVGDDGRNNDVTSNQHVSNDVDNINDNRHQSHDADVAASSTVNKDASRGDGGSSTPLCDERDTTPLRDETPA